MELKLLNAQGQAAGNVAVSDMVFARDYNEPLIHQIVVAFQANARSGNRSQLTRAEVHHSTKKPFRQKGDRPCSRWYDILPAVARRWAYFPKQTRRKL